MIVDELILKLKADISDVEKRLKEVEGKASAAGKNAGAEMGKTMGTSFGDVFSAIAGAAVLNTVKNFYSRAAAEFNKFEAAFLRVDSIAKGFGRSVDVARKNVDELAQKGFLNLNQAASSYADAIALGFDEKQARKFIDALSDVSAFQNTIGDGAAAVQSGLSGLLSNSAEKVENIGVPIKVLNMAYNENIKTMGKAAALQKFYAGVLKESEKFSGDAARAVDTLAGAQNKANAATDKAMVAIGKGLEPVLKRFYNILEDLASGFAKWFGSLDATTKSLVLMAPAVGGLVVAFGTLLPILKAISISNPFGWVALAISGLLALSAVLNEIATVNGPKVVSTYKESAAALKELGARADELAKINKRTASQEKELAESKDALKKKAKELGVDYDNLAKSAKGAGDMAERLTNIQREQAAQILQTERRKVAAGLETSRKMTSKFREQVGGDAALSATNINAMEMIAEKRIKELDAQTAELYAFDASKAPAAAGSAGGKAVEQRFLEASNKIAEIEKNRIQTIAIAKRVKDDEERKRQIDAANEDAKLQVEAEFTARRQAYAEFIEDKYMADTEALKRQTDYAIRESNEILEAGIKKAKGDEWEIFALKEDHEERLQKIRETNARKYDEIVAQSFARSAQAAQATTSGLSQLASARDVGSSTAGIGSTISGASGFSDKFKSLAPIGLGVAAIGGVVGLLSGLFGKSDDERRREAENAKSVLERQHNEQMLVLEQQAQYQKSMLALQEAAAKVPFENLQRDVRLLEIKYQQDILSGTPEETAKLNLLNSKLNALSGVVASESGRISEGALFSGTGITPDDLIAFLNERKRQEAPVASALGAFQGAANLGASSQYGWQSFGSPEGVAFLDNYFRNALSTIKAQESNLPTEVYSEITKRITDALGLLDVGSTRSQGFGGYLAGRLSTVLDSTIASNFSSEITRDTGTAENLLSVLSDQLNVQNEIKNASKKTADNTAKALELRPDRERSFIDVGQGFIQSLGQRITSPSAIGIARSVSQNLTIPTELGAANVITGRARTLQERMADALETQIRQGATANDILRDIRAAAVELLAVMDGNPGTGSSMTMNDFVSLQSEANRRRV